jgi:hypothetical protein
MLDGLTQKTLGRAQLAKLPYKICAARKESILLVGAIAGG